MNATQLKYARERANKIYKSKADEIDKEYQVKPLTVEESLEALQKGEFTIVEPVRYSRGSWASWVSFNASPVPNEEERRTRKETLQTSFTKLMDELVLGDNEKALELLKAFENNE